MAELSNVKFVSTASKSNNAKNLAATKRMNSKKTKKEVETVQKLLSINVENTILEPKPKVQKLSQSKKAVKKSKNTSKSAVDKTTGSNSSNMKLLPSIKNTESPKNMQISVGIKEGEEKKTTKIKRFLESSPTQVENNKKYPKKASGLNILITGIKEVPVDEKTVKPKIPSKSTNTKVIEKQALQKSVETKRTKPADIESVNVQTQTYPKKVKRSMKNKQKSLANGTTTTTAKSKSVAAPVMMNNERLVNDIENSGSSLP